MILITCLLIPGHLANYPPERKRVRPFFHTTHRERKKGGREERRREGKEGRRREGGREVGGDKA